MRESKAELTDRLRREGRWEAFKKRREELKAGGMEAQDAWLVAREEFPPEHVSLPFAPSIEWEEGRQSLEAATDDSEWIFLAMPIKVPQEIAGPVRWSMLQRLRESPLLRLGFERQVLNRMIGEGIRSKAKPKRDTRTFQQIMRDEQLGKSGT
ncbi:MAG: hypothetical protein AABZ47_18345 [Planctomycetota bacterium]